MPNKFIEALKEEKANLVEQLAPFEELIAKISAIDALLEKYQTGSVVQTPIVVEPNETIGINWEAVKKQALSIITREGKFIKANLISGELWGDDGTEAMKNRLSSYLGILEREGKIVKFKKDNSNLKTYWGLPNWMRGDEPDKRYFDE